jgi:hypothetical protein
MEVTVAIASHLPELDLPEDASQRPGAPAALASARIPTIRLTKMTAKTVTNTATGLRAPKENPENAGTIGWPHPSSTGVATKSTKKRNKGISNYRPSARISLPDNSHVLARWKYYHHMKRD